MKISLVCLTLFTSAHAFTGIPALKAAPSSSSLDMSAGLFYSTVGGNTETVAGYIGDAADVTPIAIEDVTPEDVMKHDSLIVGAPTWNTGADMERSMTAWDAWLYQELPKLDMAGKKLAIFGVGDSESYTDHYCDAVGELHSTFAAQGIDASFGRVSIEGYHATESLARIEGEDKFYGCLFDEDNEYDLSVGRATSWIDQLKGEGFF